VADGVKRLTAAHVDELAETVRRLLAAIAAGELVVSATTRHRLEGVLVALEPVRGASVRRSP
jgi:hypothetical protein